MHEKPKICPALYNMHQQHMKYTFFLYFYKFDVFWLLSIFPRLLSFCPLYVCKTNLFSVKHFSKITSLHTSIFENFL